MSTSPIGRGYFVARYNGLVASGSSRAKAKANLMRRMFGGAA